SGLVFSVVYIFLNLMADILSMLSNPKLRQSQI
ncbi:MAG: ABC transporter permease, partial [Deltaproteobacteria bacterium]